MSSLRNRNGTNNFSWIRSNLITRKYDIQNCLLKNQLRISQCLLHLLEVKDIRYQPNYLSLLFELTDRSALQYDAVTFQIKLNLLNYEGISKDRISLIRLTCQRPSIFQIYQTQWDGPMVRYEHKLGWKGTRGTALQQETLQWSHNGHDSVSNHQPYDCLLNRLFRRRS